MRVILPFAVLTAICVLFTANISQESAIESSFTSAALLGGNEPNLPDEPYNYEDQRFPEHLIETEWGSNDSTVMDFISNDGATLGRVLFYDEIISANENISCATCHQQSLSFADDGAFSEGVTNLTRRNSMALNDLGWSNNSAFFWDLSQTDLKEMIGLPLSDPNEIGLADIEGVIEKMENTIYYPNLFADAFGSTEITQDKIQAALSQFISSMVSFNSRFDQKSRGLVNFTAQEAAGEELFAANCSICHTDGNSLFAFGPSMGINPVEWAPFLFSNGLAPDPNDAGAGEWDEIFDNLFKIPTLRNIALTAPYMHNGSVATLEDVLDHYSDEIVPNEWIGDFIPSDGFDYSEDQKSELIAFLNTLTDESFLSDVRWSDPFGLISTTEEEPQIMDTPVSLYPNPSAGITYIGFSNPSKIKTVVKILDAQGRLMRKMSTHEEQISYDVSSYAPGFYLAELRFKNQIIRKKFIVK